jgi:capsule polysaccharide export protein KpsC/LpsZ
MSTVMSMAKTTTIYGYGFDHWKKFITDWYPSYQFYFINGKTTPEQFDAQWAIKIKKDSSAKLMLWKGRSPKYLQRFVSENKIDVLYMSEGFMCGVESKNLSVPPCSIILEDLSPYYDCSRPSGLEDLLNRYDFDSDIIEKSKKLMKTIVDQGLTQYNHQYFNDQIICEYHKKRILVVGQREDSPAVVYGCPAIRANQALIELAQFDYPDAMVIYRPHPEVILQSKGDGRKALIAKQHLKKMSDHYYVDTRDIPISQLLQTIDHVYVLNSLVGLESLIRNIPVTVVGYPFYAGWGLTDDRYPIARRARKLSIEELVAAAYLLYPKYYLGHKEVSVDDVIHYLLDNRSRLFLSMQKNASLPQITTVQTSKPENAPMPNIVSSEPKALRSRRHGLVYGDIKFKQVFRTYFHDYQLFFMVDEQSEEDTLKQFKTLATSQGELLLWHRAQLSESVRQHIDDLKIKIRYIGMGLIGENPSSSKNPTESIYLESRITEDTIFHENDLKLASQLIKMLRTHKQPMTGAKSSLKINLGTDVNILVLGDIQSINNADLLEIVMKKFAKANIWLLPARRGQKHPVLSKTYQVLDAHTPLVDLLPQVQYVYAHESKFGFEALIHQAKVIVTGKPFYAGYGLTEDLNDALKKSTQVYTLEQLVVDICLKKSRYQNLETKQMVSPQDILNRLAGLPLIDLEPIEKIEKLEAELKKKIPVIESAASGFPTWFNAYPTHLMQSGLQSGKPVFLYVPWIAEHGNSLIARISHPDYELVPLDFIKDLDVNRRSVLSFARDNPVLYRKMLIRRLVPLRNQIAGMLFTFDWSPVMRLIATVCEELEIPRILIPHESVFVDRNKYYRDMKSHASIPVADITLGWGGLQQEIFIERGYPKERFLAVGAPKFDPYVNYQSQLSRQQFCRLFGLDATRKIILFASQPLDSQLNTKLARECQRNAISDLLDAAELNDHQLIVRLPPSKDNILGEELQSRLEKSQQAAIDDALCYLVGAEEALYHCDLVTSVNSTMLFEGVLQGRPALSVKYIEFDQIWEQVGIPAVTTREQLFNILNTVIHDWKPSEEGMNWAAHMFSNGAFDGKASQRIQDYLSKLSQDPSILTRRLGAQERLFSRDSDPIDVIGIHSGGASVDTTQRYLISMLNGKKRVHTIKGLDQPIEICSVDLYVQWGITERPEKERQAQAQRALGRPRVVVEDGFIRSLDIGLSGESALSIIIDDTTAYYDAASRPSRLERLLQDGESLTRTEQTRAGRVIKKIVNARISKYNHAPDMPVQLGTEGRPKILLIDQRFGDQSIVAGLADETTFECMLTDAIQQYPDHDIIIKQHPDAIKGGKSSYYSDERLKALQYVKHVYPINFDINPYALFDIVDKVFVATSGMGFEGLMAGKEVHCYGVPFYAGWGLTIDHQNFPRRSRKRTLKDVFHFAYIESSRYYQPELARVCEVEELVDYIKTAKRV